MHREIPRDTGLMNARAEDVDLARSIAARIHAADPERVRRAVMIGSRARGTARPDSDLDLVVVVEWPEPDRRWTPADAQREKDAILRHVPPPPIHTDLWVRNTDRFEEARGVAGGVEWLADHEGIEVLSVPYVRRAVVRSPPEAVRRELMSAWVHHAISALAAAHGAARPLDQRHRYAEIAVERIVTALLVHQGCWPAESASLLDRISDVDGASRAVGARIHEQLNRTGRSTPEAAREIILDVVTHLARDGATAAVLQNARARLRPFER